MATTQSIEWRIIEEGIAKLKRILGREGESNEHFDSQSYLQIYTTIFNMGRQKSSNDQGDLLYGKCCKFFKHCCISIVIPSLKCKHGVCLLQDFVQRWADYKIMIRWMSHFFDHLDRYYIREHFLPGLKEVAVCCFRELVYKQIMENVRDVVISFIQKERAGGHIDRVLLKNVLAVFIDMGRVSYELDFEGTLLEDTASFYQRQAEDWIVEKSCQGYLAIRQECLTKEKGRVSHYLHSDTVVKLINRVKQELGVLYANQFLAKYSSLSVLTGDKADDISAIYTLCSMSPPFLKYFASQYKDHIIKLGMPLMKEAQDAETNQKSDSIAHILVFVPKVILMHNKYCEYVKDCFEGNLQFYKALKEAFKFLFYENNAAKSGDEILAIYCHHILKKKLSYKVMEKMFDKVIKMVHYVGCVGSFSEFCRKNLVDRLLFSMTANIENELSFLAKMEGQFSRRFTDKMKNMLTDFTLSKETQKEFKEFLDTVPQRDPKIDFAVNVLTSEMWESYKSSELNLPAEMVRCVENFEGFYGTKTKKRKLSWIHSLGCCTINGNFESTTIELTMTTYQACALLLFNNSERLTYSEIRQQLNLKDNDVKRILHSLSCAGYKILNKEPSTKTVNQLDVFEFNHMFSDERRSIKILLPPQEEEIGVIEDFSLTIDAALMRIMKKQKRLDHPQLMKECIEEVSKTFKPDEKLIKKRIERMIGLNRLERDATNPDVYNYSVE